MPDRLLITVSTAQFDGLVKKSFAAMRPKAGHLSPAPIARLVESEGKMPFHLQESQVISVKIYDILGREIEALLMNEFMPAGRHEFVCNAQYASCGLYAN